MTATIIVGVDVETIQKISFAVQEVKKYNEDTGEPYVKDIYLTSVHIGNISTQKRPDETIIQMELRLLEEIEKEVDLAFIRFNDDYLHEGVLGIVVSECDECENRLLSVQAINESIQQCTDKFLQIGIAVTNLDVYLINRYSG